MPTAVTAENEARADVRVGGLQVAIEKKTGVTDEPKPKKLRRRKYANVAVGMQDSDNRQYLKALIDTSNS